MTRRAQPCRRVMAEATSDLACPVFDPDAKGMDGGRRFFSTVRLDIVEYLDGGLTAKTVRQAAARISANKYIPDKKWGEA